MSKLPKGVFSSVLEYFEPEISERVTDQKYKTERPINYTWPEVVSYHNPVSEARFNDGWHFNLKSGW